MPRQAIHSDRAPAAIGPYSQATRAGSMVFFSGQVPIDPATGSLVGDVAFHQFAGGRIQRDLPRAEHEVAGGRGLRIRADRGGRMVAVDGLARHVGHLFGVPAS